MYVPLRVHGHHSLLSGTDSPREVLARARELELPALALCDVDNIAGVVDFLTAGDEQEAENPRSAVRPIVGAELSDPLGEPGRVVALVKDERGYRNLCRMVSARRLGRDPGEHGADLGTPEEDFDLVRAAAKWHEGLILLVDHPRLLTGLCGRVPRENVLAAISPAALSKGRARRSREVRPGESRNTHLARLAREAREPRRVEGEAWGETESESELPGEKVPPPSHSVPASELIEAARATGFGIVAVPDVYHALHSGRAHHRVRTAIKHNALIHDLPEEWLAEAPAHLPTAAEMRALYTGLEDVPGPWTLRPTNGTPPMVARSLELASLCTWRPPLGGVHFPKVELAPGESPYSKLCELSFDGAQVRYKPLRQEVVRRLDYELSTIDDLGFAAYFLLVHQIAEYAKGQGIPCVGRGSAADSLVAYCLGLTDADPFRYKLIFERFLNPARNDRPDIDLDFCWRRRDEVIEHVYELFGAERTAMICTLNCFGLRAAFRESALVEGIPPAEVNRWSRRLPHYDAPGSSTPHDGTPEAGGKHRVFADAADSRCAAALRATPEARGFPFDDPRWQRVLRAADALIDRPRHFGLHPGGVVVAPERITDLVACQRAAKGVVVTQLDKDAVEAVGLVKMDLLGNRALSVVDDCVRALRERGTVVEPEEIPEDDPATARTLREGRTLACFQVESPGMRNLLKQTRANDMDSVIQAVAMIRPGPASSGMKDAYVRRFRGLEEPTPPHPRLTDLLWETQGVMLYQEDVMQAASLMAGMDLAEADQLRRALKKRRADQLGLLKRRFLAGCDEQGIARAEAAPVWELICNFASFGFCKAHAVTYGRIAYRCVWLKTHYPAVFMNAFLANDTGYYQRRVYVEEARRMGVAILPPDVNRSEDGFSLVGDPPSLRVGLGLVKGLTRRTLDAILEERVAGGSFLSLPDFLERSGARVDEVRTLIQCGALDAFDRTRPELLWRLHLIVTPQRRPPKELRRAGANALDAGQLAACKATPEQRNVERLLAARAKSGGWRGGLGMGSLALKVGESTPLFPEPEAPGLVLPGLPDAAREERGRMEYELLGLTVQDHPTRIFGGRGEPDASPREAQRPDRIACGELERFRGGRVRLYGWPAATRRVRTSDGRWMRFLTLEDESGLAEVVVFADVYERDGHRLAGLGNLSVVGVVQDQLGACTLEAERIE